VRALLSPHANESHCQYWRELLGENFAEEIVNQAHEDIRNGNYEKEGMKRGRKRNSEATA
jgi:hypothetical protein